MNEKKSVDEWAVKICAAKTTDEIIAISRESDDAAERERIIKSMNPAFRKKLNNIETWLRREMAHTLRSRYELGLQVLELHNDEKKNGGKLYGKNAIGRICKILRWDDGLIRLALKFVQRYTLDDLERLCAVVMPGGQPLDWSHLRILLTLPDAAKRQELLDKTVTEGWTCGELAYEIHKSEHRLIVDGRGRPPRIPTDFDGALGQQQQSAEQWDRMHDKVWNKPSHSLLGHASRLPPDQITQDRLLHARELANWLRRVANQVIAQAEDAEKVVRDFEHILDQQSAAKGLAKTSTAACREKQGASTS